MRGASWYREIHERLLAEDPTAPAELAEAVLEPLNRALEKKYPRVADSALIADAVTDALIDYLKHPRNFDPTKRGLYGYLLMAAQADLRNALAKRGRRHDKETAVEDVEVAAVAGKVVVEARNLVAELEAERLRREIHELFEEPKDRKMIELILDGERSTEAFAAVLGIETWTIDEQRLEIKRHKDRLKKRLRDYGQRIRHENQ